MKKILAALVLGLLFCSTAFTADCIKTGATCSDSTPCKSISGVQVCLAGVTPPPNGINTTASCWTYTDTYNCLQPNAVNYCEPFLNSQPACWQTGTACSEMDTTFGTGCIRYTQTWRCGDSNSPTPTNTIKLDDSYTLVSSDFDTTPCSSASSSNCTVAESVCVSTTPPATLPPGISPDEVAPDGCYEKQNKYVCLTGESDTSECAQYSSDPKCTLNNATCEETANGSCTYQTQTYKCETTPPSTGTELDCSGRKFCTDGSCYEAAHSPDRDFGVAMSMLEVAREGSVYADDQKNLFGGEANKCDVKLFGLKNCCKSAGGGGGMSNGMLLGLSASAAGQALKYGSYYTYDSLMKNGSEYLAKGVGAISGASATAAKSVDGTALSGFSPSLSMYGFSVSLGAAPTGATVLGQAGNFTFAFDPTSLAISVAIMVVTEMMACDPNEQLFSLKKGQNLCHSLGSYCSKKVLFVCTQRTQGYCCFNSKLARIVNEQGRAQIGKGWGGAKSPDCSGFTLEEFQRLDFAQMDLSEFINDIVSHTQTPIEGGIAQGAQSAIQQKVTNYYNQGNQ